MEGTQRSSSSGPAATVRNTEVKRSQLACAVSGCKGSHNQDTSFHRVPKDLPCQRAWLIFCQRQGPVNVSTLKVCSRHFTAECFGQDPRAELMGFKPKRLLQIGAIPQDQGFKDDFIIKDDVNSEKTSTNQVCLIDFDTQIILFLFVLQYFCIEELSHHPHAPPPSYQLRIIKKCPV